VSRRPLRGDQDDQDDQSGDQGAQGDQSDQDDQHDDADAEATAASSAIARLRRRLRQLRTFDNPKLRRELHKLEEEIAARYEQDMPNPGRHRASSTPDEQGGQQAGGPGDLDLKPDPATAQTARALIEVLVRYKVWSGDLPWRKIAARARQKRVASTLCAAMKRNVLPTREVIEAIITGCGGSQDDLDDFIAAWQRISATGGQPRR
jgi:hypothetical protein